MKVDLTLYTTNKHFLHEYYRKYGYEEQVVTICNLSIATHVPVVVLAFYLAELLGFTEELTTTIERLIKFYGYTKIVGQPENSPFLHLS